MTSSLKFPIGAVNEDVGANRQKAPVEILATVLKMFSNKNKTYHNKDILAYIIWQDPSTAKYLARTQVPFGVMYDAKKINEIDSDMTLSEKRIRLSKAAQDTSRLRAITISKATIIKKRLRAKGHSIASAPEMGSLEASSISVSSAAKHLHYILRWNNGQIDTWHDLKSKFDKQCKDAKLKAILNTYSKVAMNEKSLPKLTEMMKKFAQEH